MRERERREERRRGARARDQRAILIGARLHFDATLWHSILQILENDFKSGERVVQKSIRNRAHLHFAPKLGRSTEKSFPYQDQSLSYFKTSKIQSNIQNKLM